MKPRSSMGKKHCFTQNTFSWMFIIIAEASHSENSRSVRDRVCRLCVVGLTTQSLTFSDCTVSHFVVFYITRILFELLYGHVVACLSRSSACPFGHQSLWFLHSPACPSIHPLGWWMSCGFWMPTMSEGRPCLSTSGSRDQKLHIR